MKKYLIILFLFLGLSNLFAVQTYKLDSVNYRNTKSIPMNLKWLGWQKTSNTFKIDIDIDNKTIILYTNVKLVYKFKRLTEDNTINCKTISGFSTSNGNDVFVTIYYYRNNKKYIDLSYIYDGFIIKYLLK